MIDVIQQTYFRWMAFWEWSLTISDPRSKEWMLMESPWPTLQLTGLYLAMVYFGPMYMKDKSAVSCRLYLAVYNLALVLLNLYIFVELVIGTTEAGYSYQCQRCVYSYEKNELRIARALWWYYFSKCVEFLDTAFFIIRKKNNQITFLHVYHHATMFPLWWIGIKWVAGGQSFFGAMLNSFVHVVMYTYYGLSTLGPHIQKYLWWKRYMTKLQLLQFFVGLVYGAQSLYLGCDFPLWMQYACFAYALSMVALFSNFYLQTYINSSKTMAKTSICNSADSVKNSSLHSNGKHLRNG